DQIRFVGGDGGIVARERRLARRGERQHVVQRDGLEERLEIVKAVAAASENAERPVDFCGGEDAHHEEEEYGSSFRSAPTQSALSKRRLHRRTPKADAARRPRDTTPAPSARSASRRSRRCRGA